MICRSARDAGLGFFGMVDGVFVFEGWTGEKSSTMYLPRPSRLCYWKRMSVRVVGRDYCGQHRILSFEQIERLGPPRTAVLGMTQRASPIAVLGFQNLR